MAIIATQTPGQAGITPSVSTAAGGGDKVSPGCRVHVVNGAGAPITVTIATPNTVRGLAIADQTVTVPNGTFPANLKSFDVPADLYRNPSDGLVDITYSSATSVSLWVEGPVQS